jgi:hypothetical protein
MIIMNRYCVNKWDRKYRTAHTIRFNKFKRVEGIKDYTITKGKSK